MRKIKDLNKWKNISCSWIRRLSIVKMDIFLTLSYKFNVIPINIPPEKLENWVSLLAFPLTVVGPRDKDTNRSPSHSLLSSLLPPALPPGSVLCHEGPHSGVCACVSPPPGTTANLPSLSPVMNSSPLATPSECAPWKVACFQEDRSRTVVKLVARKMLSESHLGKEFHSSFYQRHGLEAESWAPDSCITPAPLTTQKAAKGIPASNASWTLVWNSSLGILLQCRFNRSSVRPVGLMTNKLPGDAFSAAGLWATVE